jgi:formate hydrogenlyase subunit 6/NADH:ubiquinone oxidoreductase subunit I
MQAILGLWKGIGFGFCEEACPRRALHPNYTMEGVNLAPMKEEKRLTFHSPILEKA